jgi:predicted metal-dependent phosphoesterase TrpH
VSQVDLHIHSTASDGKFSPEAIVAKAAALGLAVISLADHDSIDGISEALEAARAFPRLRVIPGVEISTDMPYGETHILGYFIDYSSDKLKSALERFRNYRQIRAQGIIAKLRKLGVYVDWQRVREIAGEGSIGRPHIAQAMLEKGYINSIKDAFHGYIEHGGPAYVEREKMTPAEALALIVQSDGLPVLAHPFTVAEPEALVIELKAAGLVGIEAYYNGYIADEIRSLVSLADKHGLITTGGSDYHGLDDHDETMLGGVEVPMAAAERLISLATERGLRLAKL